MYFSEYSASECILDWRCSSDYFATILTYKRVYDTLGGYSLDPTALRVEDRELWFRFLAEGFRGYNLPDELYIMVENIGAVKRRTLKARINGARITSRGLKRLGYHGLRCWTPYFDILKYFVPTFLYQKIHEYRLKTKKIQ